MHLYLITRGHKPDVDRFIAELQGVYNPFNYQGQRMMVGTQVRPIQFWEIVFPEKALDVMLRSILEDNQGMAATPHIQKYLAAMRLGLKLQKIPPYEYCNKFGKRLPYHPLYLNNVEKIGVGIKPDYYKENENTKTEGL